MIEGARIFITGGAGFIGSTLVGEYIERNEVVVFDSFARDSLRSRPFANHRNLRIVRGDVLDADAVRNAIDGANYVVHAAAIAGIDTVILSPTQTLRVNMLGTANVLDACRSLTDCKRFLDFSTSEVFGSRAYNSHEGDKTEIGAVGEARWTYAVSKLAGEHLTHAYFREFGLPTVSVRPFNVYGPGQIGEGAIMKFIQKALRNEDIEIHGNGTQIRAWCFVDDMVRGLKMCLENDNAVGESFNIGNATAVTTIYGLANAVVRVLGSQSNIRFVRRDYADIELRIPAVEKAFEKLGFLAEVDLEEGIRRTREYYALRRAA